MENITLKINDIDVTVPKGTTILDAAKKANVHIPTLCHMDLHDIGMVNAVASCRVCMVEVEGRGTLVPSCAETAVDGMVVRTDSMRAIRARRMSVELLLSNHPKDCLTCSKNLDCELQSLAQELGVRAIHWQGDMMDYPVDKSSLAIVKNPNKCVMCRRCETVCNEVQTCGILSGLNRGFDAFVGPAFNLPMSETSCTYCGQCVAVCPTAALTEVNHTHQVWREIHNEDRHVVVQVAPSIRVAIGEMFGMDVGTITTGKLASSLRRIGFDAVFDTDWAADLTIMEEASELVHRIQHNGTLPMLTSCCPAWVQFFEHQFPDLLDIPSSCKSPQIMFGTMAKTYYAEKMGIDPKKITVVAIMPCLAKKFEAARDELSNDGLKNVDYVLTTREFGAMLKEAGIDFATLPDSDFDSLLGESSGAGVIFGSTGGVIEAAVRTAADMIAGKEIEKIDYHNLRGLDGIREATVKVEDLEINIGIAHGLGNARKLLEDIRSGKSQYHAIEIMACPGGCIGGGGQPYHHGNMEVIKKRQAAIYKEDAGKKRRKSHENPMIKKIYEEYLGEPYGHRAHELLHTQYFAKEKI